MSDFTFRDPLTGIIRFNDANVIHIGYEPSSEDITITAQNDETGTSKTINVNMSGGGGSAVLGTKTITENGTYNASADSLDGYSSVTVNVPASGITVDDVAEKNISGDIELTTATTIKFGAFAESGITSVTGTVPTKVETEAFRYCDSLVTVNLPNVQNVNTANYAFANCANLEEVYLPKLSNISSTTYMCATCPKLKVADLGVIGSLINNLFNGDTDLRTLVLRKTGSICTTSWANAAVFGGIYNNPDESTIYVPEDLITTYQNATNWSALYSMGVTFANIEGSIYE